LKGLPKLRKSSDKVGTKIGNSEKTQLAASETVQKNIQAKVYLKALPLRALGDVDIIKREIELGNILILKVSPLAVKSIDDVKVAVSELVEFTKSVGGDIARLGEERVVITPAPIRIWREKTVAPNGAMPTAA
jgi:SepF-like predicted cell division protein (DUF552 family)